jgi:SAM-dependent methyltransferase
MTRFGTEYLDYWKQRQQNPGKDAPAPAEQVVHAYLDALPLGPGSEIIDIGCGHGRCAPILRAITQSVDGVEVDPDVVALVEGQGLYRQMFQATAEHTGVADESYDCAVCWAVFDFLDQERALAELHRILRPGGIVVLTGKNDNYQPDDHLGWVAEVKVRMKGFAHSFTRAGELVASLPTLGFTTRLVHGFARRGDFARMDAIDLLAGRTDAPFYDFCLVAKKTGPWTAAAGWSVSSPFSQVARTRAGTDDDALLDAFMRSEAQRLEE